MRKKEFRILEVDGCFRVQRQFKEKKLVRRGLLKNDYEFIMEWQAVCEKGCQTIYFDSFGGWVSPPQKPFKSMKKARAFIIRVCEKPKYHYPFK
jgi:hypothetical protein